MSKVVVFDHPLIHHKLTYLRDINTKHFIFKKTVDEITLLMAYEATRNLTLKPKDIETPIEKMTGNVLEKEVVIVPILRAGLGMVEGILTLIPTARTGHLGMFRDPKTLEPVVYYKKFPDQIKDGAVFVVDPMLATGVSAIEAIKIVKESGAKNICFMGLVGCPEGVEALHQAHPDVPIYLAALDEKLNEHAYIVPGLGDAGDRLYGTK